METKQTKTLSDSAHIDVICYEVSGLRTLVLHTRQML